MVQRPWAVIAGWATGVAAVLMAAGGVAHRPGGWTLGVPTAGQVVLAIAGATGLGLSARPGGGRLLLGVLPALLGLFLGLTVPGVGALSGGPLCALVLAGAAAALVATPPSWRHMAFLPVVAAVYLVGAARVQEQVGPEGDEPHYLMVADSLLRDHDLDLERDYAEGRYRPFHPAPLAPHYRIRGRGGEIYSLHAVGLSILVLPAYAVGGYRGASFFMAALGVWLAWEIRRLVAAWTGDLDLACGVGWLVALAPPLLSYVGLVFTEVPAALGVALALRWAREGAAPRKSLLYGVVLAVLPWLHVRYAVLAALLYAYVLLQRPGLRSAAAWLVAPFVSAVALAFYHFSLYGFFDPRRVYGRRPELALGILPTGLPGLFLDQEFGLLVYAPVFALAAPGLWRILRASLREGALLSIALAAVIVTAGAWPMWRGGFNPPARFLVPLVPILALAVAARLRTGLGAGAAVLVGWSLWTGLAGWWTPRLVHRDRDGTAPLFRTLSGGEEWTRLLPGFVLDASAADRGRLAVVWTAALGVAAIVGMRSARRVTASRLALATLGTMTAAGIASSLSTGRTEGRDAVRALGRPGLDTPGWQGFRHVPARWTPAELTWGPIYEPHRSPVVLGERLLLPPGPYRLFLAVDTIPSDSPPATLEALPEGAPEGPRAPFLAEAGGLAVTFVVPPGQRATTLLARDGGPFILKELRLEASTFPD